MLVKVPTNIIRNEDFKLSNGSFILYVRLCHLYFKNFRNEEIKLDHRKLMLNIGITDIRTLKKRFTELVSCKLIKNESVKFPKKGETVILLNGKVIDNSKVFTMMNVTVFDELSKIDEHAFRLLFYYKSHINRKDPKGIKFCFVGMETLSHNLKMAKKTIISSNNMLRKSKLIKIEKHKLEQLEETYDENDELIYERWNNHYFVNDKLF